MADKFFCSWQVSCWRKTKKLRKVRPEIESEFRLAMKVLMDGDGRFRRFKVEEKKRQP